MEVITLNPAWEPSVTAPAGRVRGSVCSREPWGATFGCLGLSLEAVSQQSPRGRQSQAGMPGMRGKGSLSAVSQQEKWPEPIPRAE